MSPTIKSHKYKTPKEKFETHKKRARIIFWAVLVLSAILLYKNWDWIWLNIQSWAT